MKHLFSTFSFALAFSLSLMFSGCVGKQTTSLVDQPQAFAESFGFGWNLGNNFDAAVAGVSGETAWGNPVCTQETMDNLYAKGIRSVRVPVSWVGHIGAAPDYQLEKAYLDRVAEVIGYAEKAGLKCVINIHHDGNPDVAGPNYWLDPYKAATDSAYHAQVCRQMYAVWNQIAAHMNAFSVETLIFEALNEVQDGGYGNTFRGYEAEQMACVNEWQQAFVDAVRATGGNNANRYLAVTSYYAKVKHAVDYLQLPADPTPNRLMVAVHSYDPWFFAGTAEQTSWGHTGCYGTTEQEVDDMFHGLYDRFASQGVPVYFGEFGCVTPETKEAQAFQLYYMQYFVKTGRKYGIPCMLWDNGHLQLGDDSFGYIHHGTGEYIVEGATLIPACVAAWNDTTVTQQDIYNAAPVF